jgi:hypothetical protein
MKIDLQAFEVWESLNGAVADILAKPPGHILRCYPGLGLGLFELAVGTAHFYSHKKSVGLVEGATPYFQAVLPYLYREGFQVQVAPGHNDWKGWVESLSKDTGFVMVCEDHAVTGEIYDIDELDRSLNERKIFCLRVSHHTHFSTTSDLRPYSARLCSFDPITSVAFLGSKWKSPPLAVSLMSWEPHQFLSRLQRVKSAYAEDRSLVQNFERNLPEGFSALLQTSSRCFDRALIYSESTNGEALLQFLSSALGQGLSSPGLEARIETTSLCRWGGTKSYDLWWKPRPAESILRGLLILDAEVLKHSQIKALLEQALRECQIAELG